MNITAWSEQFGIGDTNSSATIGPRSHTCCGWPAPVQCQRRRSIFGYMRRVSWTGIDAMYGDQETYAWSLRHVLSAAREVGNQAYDAPLRAYWQLWSIHLSTGFRLDDHRMISELSMIEQMWPGGNQPVTGAPSIFPLAMLRTALRGGDTSAPSANGGHSFGRWE